MAATVLPILSDRQAFVYEDRLIDRDWYSYFNNLVAAIQLLQVQVAALTAAAALTQRSINGAGALPIQTTDQVLNFNLSAPLTITLPDSIARAGRPIYFKDALGNFDVNNLTVNTTGGQTIDGLASGVLVLSLNRQWIGFRPFNDGVNTGWAII